MMIADRFPCFHSYSIEIEEQYYEKSKELPVELYLTMGSDENKNYMVPCFYRFSGILDTRNYLHFKQKMIIGYEQKHSTNEVSLLPKVLMMIYGL